MAGATAIRIALGCLLAFAFLGWILSIIGLAGLQRNCWSMQTLGQTVQTPALSTGGEVSIPLASNLALTGVRGFNGNLDCDDVYRYYWWQIAFELVTLIGLSCLAAFGLLAASALSWLAWLVVLSALWMQGSDSFLAIQHVGNGLGFWNYIYARLAAAGWIITTTANLGLIFLLGWRPKKLRSGAGGPITY